MKIYRRKLQRIRFLLSLATLNVASLGFLMYVVSPTSVSQSTVYAQPAPAIVQKTQPAPLADNKVVAGKPIRLFVSSLGIDIAIENGVYDYETDTWSLSDYGAHYATPTPLVNNKAGNTLLYGHNNDRVFGKLPQLKQGETIMIHTDNGHIFTYKLVSTVEVLPDNMSVFQPSALPMLTIQTCTGNWNELRHMSQFMLSSYVE